jgi:hypothetical protein
MELAKIRPDINRDYTHVKLRTRIDQEEREIVPDVLKKILEEIDSKVSVKDSSLNLHTLPYYVVLHENNKKIVLEELRERGFGLVDNGMNVKFH